MRKKITNEQITRIKKGDWKSLIILDACRYDYFNDIYSEYLPGKLKKLNTPVSPKSGMVTSEWCKRVFSGKFENIIYVSANPRINSKIEVDGFNASDHFSEIVDVWDYGWDDSVGTVLPEEVNRSLEKTLRSSGGKKIIVHYMQPHEPFLSEAPPEKLKTRDPKARNSIKKKVVKFFGSQIRKHVNSKRTAKLMELFGIPPMNHIYEIYRKKGEQGLREAYTKNLELVLQSLSQIIDRLPKKTIVTADHGELLGEKNYVGHSFAPEIPAIKEVPWLEID